MRTALLRVSAPLVGALLIIVPAAQAQQGTPVARPAAVLKLVDSEQSPEIAVQVSIDDLTYDEYWQKTFDAIFDFVDANSDGMLDDKEILLAPSARAIRLSLGTGFAPPIASLQSVQEVVQGDSTKCSKEQFRNYYLNHGAGRVLVGCGKLSNTAAITEALLGALDEDGDGRLSEGELLKAETVLQRFDTNDDELIGVGELIPSGTYPGNWASNVLHPSSSIDLSPEGNRKLMLSRLQSPSTLANAPGSVPQRQSSQQPATDSPSTRTMWQIAIGDQVRDVPLQVNSQARCESWSVTGQINDLYVELKKDLAKAATASATETTDAGARNRRPTRDWLTTVADRDHDGAASQTEVDQWLALQQKLIHGQLLISVYHGGGLFELLDSNHDAGLSVRELRSAWRNLRSASSPTAAQIDLKRLPNVVLLVVSQGYPTSFARTMTSDVEWFRQMDRNADGDVSRREFTGSPDAFSRLDLDRDSLISPSEAGEAR